MITAPRLVIRTSATPGFVAGVVRDAVRTVDPTVRVLRVAPYAEYPAGAARLAALQRARAAGVRRRRRC